MCGSLPLLQPPFLLPETSLKSTVRPVDCLDPSSKQGESTMTINEAWQRNTVRSLLSLYVPSKLERLPSMKDTSILLFIFQQYLSIVRVESFRLSFSSIVQLSAKQTSTLSQPITYPSHSFLTCYDVFQEINISSLVAKCGVG